MAAQPLLQLDHLTKKFGSLVAVNDVSFAIHPGEILGLIGPNGAGKTTLYNTVTGLLKPDGGRVRFKGEDISGLEPHKICRLGMSRTFQVTKTFTNMSVEEAVRVGAYNRKNEREVERKVEEVIAFLSLEEIREKRCDELGLAFLKRVEVARAFATGAELLLLDEAGAGLNAAEIAELMDTLRKLNQSAGVTLCVVEHVMQMVMGICQRIIVLDYGELIAEGSPEEISMDERVITAYLGRRARL